MVGSPSAQPRKARNRGRNTKAGCKTCKIRRKKCDETKPACIRCSSTGRTCDFLSSYSIKQGARTLRESSTAERDASQSLGRPLKIGPTLSLLHLGSSAEAAHFEYFQLECTEEFSGFFNAFLWKRLVMQAAYTEPFILHAVLAIGSLRRLQLHSHTPIPTMESADGVYITKKYAIALQTLRQRLQDRTVDWRLVSMGTLVFLAIEVLQGNEHGAIVHFRNGKQILRSLGRKKTGFRDASPSRISFSQDVSCYGIIADDIIAAFTRLSVEEELFVGISGSDSTDLPPLAAAFETISEAGTALNSIMAATFAFLRRYGDVDLKTLPLKPLPKTVATRFSTIQCSFQNWYSLFNSFLSHKNTSDTQAGVRADMLLVHYLVTWIRLSTYFYNNELIYDEYIVSFQRVLNISSTIITRQIALRELHKGPCFTLDIAMAQPLYFVARKCRDSYLRMKAIDEMKKVGEMGVYSGRVVAKVSEWVVQTETGGCELGDFVTEDRRLIEVHFELDDVDWGTRFGKVRASRRKDDCTLELLNVDLDLL